MTSPAAVAAVARSANQSLPDKEYKPYQAIILAEFILAELLVAATPFATKKNPDGLSPYVARDLTKLLAIGLLFFLLELLAVAGYSWGRLGAWLGGLVLLTVGLNEAANLSKVLTIFGGGTTTSSAPQKATTFAPPQPTEGQAV